MCRPSNVSVAIFSVCSYSMPMTKRAFPKSPRGIYQITSYSQVILQSQTRTITGPAIQSEHFAPAQLLLTEVFDHAAAHLGEGGAHDFSEISLKFMLAMILARDVERCYIRT